MKSNARLLGLMLFALVLAGCVTLGPDYERPELSTPASYRGAAAEAPAASSIAADDWRNLFQDETLRELVESALADGFDARIAAARIDQARALAGLADADRYPTLDLQASAGKQRATDGTGAPRTTEHYVVGAGLAWELDFWGRYRRASESARAQLVAAEWGAHAVATSLVADVASGYYALRALDLEREIALRTLDSRKESLRLTTVRESGGAASLVDVRQAEQLVHGAEAALIELDRRIERQENALSLLLGRDPGAIPRGFTLEGQPRVAGLPEGLPSELLERRPDIREAEAILHSTTADIGFAKSAYFPRIALTGFGGTASGALADLFRGPSGIWSAVASAVAPIVDGGRARSGVRYAEAKRAEATASYERAVRTAFREVSDALVDYRRSGELRATQRELVDAAADARRLADIRYRGGAASYLEVLDSESRLFQAEVALVEVELGELDAYVEIYRALGGGWTEEAGKGTNDVL